MIDTKNIGTADYCSPQVIEDGLVNTRSDLWSFGCLLYYMLNGHSPFNKKTDYLTLKGIAQYATHPDRIILNEKLDKIIFGSINKSTLIDFDEVKDAVIESINLLYQ